MVFINVQCAAMASSIKLTLPVSPLWFLLHHRMSVTVRHQRLVQQTDHLDSPQQGQLGDHLGHRLIQTETHPAKLTVNSFTECHIQLLY